MTTTTRPSTTKPPKPPKSATPPPPEAETSLAPSLNTIEITQYEALQHEIAIARQNAVEEFPYHTPQGNKAARSYVYTLRKLRGKIDRARKDAKAYALELGRQIDSQAKLLTVEVESLIAPHQAELDAIEQAEAERIAAHEQVIAEIRDAGALAAHAANSLDTLDTSSAAATCVANLRTSWAEISRLDLSGMEEYRGEALAARAAAIDQFSQACLTLEQHQAELLATEREAEREAARKQAEREEAIRQAAAQAARQKAEAEAAEALAAAQRETEEAAARAQAAEQQAEEDRKARADAEYRLALQEAEPAPHPVGAALDAVLAAAERPVPPYPVGIDIDSKLRVLGAEPSPEAIADTRKALEDHLVVQIGSGIRELLNQGKGPRTIARRLVTGRLHDAIRVDWGAVTIFPTPEAG